MPFDDMRDKMIPQPEPIAAMQSQYVRNFTVYDVSNPHPGFGKDPNILNEFGHTKYPKWVIKPDGEKAIANNEEEETALTKNDNNKEAVDILALKQDGPTIDEYTARGYDPSTYPPKGYAKKSSDEEIQAAIAKHNKSGW